MDYDYRLHDLERGQINLRDELRREMRKNHSDLLDRIDELVDRIRDLEQRVANLELPPQYEDCDVHDHIGASQEIVSQSDDCGWNNYLESQKTGFGYE